MPILSPEFWADLSPGQKIIIVLILVLGTLGAAALKLLTSKLERTRATVEKTLVHAAHAETLSKPTGNGFAGRTEYQLNHIVAGLERIEDSVYQLQRADHAIRRRLDRIEEEAKGE